MSLSKQLAELNVDRYKEFDHNHKEDYSRPSLLAFNGVVYHKLQTETFDEKNGVCPEAFSYSFSLYRLLRPLDLIQLYRLEMDTKLAFDDYKILYEYWANKILDLLLDDLKARGDDIIVNLASVE